MAKLLACNLVVNALGSSAEITLRYPPSPGCEALTRQYAAKSSSPVVAENGSLRLGRTSCRACLNMALLHAYLLPSFLYEWMRKDGQEPSAKCSKQGPSAILNASA